MNHHIGSHRVAQLWARLVWENDDVPGARVVACLNRLALIDRDSLILTGLFHGHLGVTLAVQDQQRRLEIAHQLDSVVLERDQRRAVHDHGLNIAPGGCQQRRHAAARRHAVKSDAVRLGSGYRACCIHQRTETIDALGRRIRAVDESG